MSLKRWASLAAIAGIVAGCATVPPPPAGPTEAIPPPAPAVAEPAPQPMIEHPPIESVEPPVSVATAAPTVSPEVAPPAPTLPLEPSAVPIVPPSAVEPSEDLQLAALLADLQRYGGMGSDDVRRELATANQGLARQRSDAMRVRVAVLYTLAKTSPQDDQRALQLLETVAKSNPGSPALKQLAAVLQAQILERMRAVRDEQAKAEAATKKLDALRSMERDLLRDRVRGGGGGGGGGGSSGGGGGGGGG